MESKELRKRLRTLGKQAKERFEYLNHGGCCVFAAAVAKELERLGVEHEVIVSGDKTMDLSEIRHRVNNVNNKREWNDAGVWFGHVGVRLKLNDRWHTYDSDSMRRSQYTFGAGPIYTAAQGGMTAKEAKALADEASGWNSAFARSNVRPLRKLVREVMREPQAPTLINRIKTKFAAIGAPW